MAGKSYYQINPVVSRYPASPPPRIELNILQSAYDQTEYLNDDVSMQEPNRKVKVCPRCPDTSSRTIPSMVYDAIRCPHHGQHYISPTQYTVLTHPWSANTLDRHMQSQSLSRSSSLKTDVISFISEDNDTLAPSPVGYPVTEKTAPPLLNVHNVGNYPPFTAQLMETFDSSGLGHRVKRSESIDIKSNDSRYHEQGPFPQGREFIGKYVDPSDGSIYNYKIRYGKNPNASRHLAGRIEDCSRKGIPRQMHSRRDKNDTPHPQK